MQLVEEREKKSWNSTICVKVMKFTIVSEHRVFSNAPVLANFSLPVWNKSIYGLEVVAFSSVCPTISAWINRHLKKLLFNKGMVPVAPGSGRAACCVAGSRAGRWAELSYQLWPSCSCRTHVWPHGCTRPQICWGQSSWWGDSSLWSHLLSHGYILL